MEDMIRGQECWFQFENRLNKIWEDNKNAFEGLEKQTRWRLTLAQNIEKLEILYFEIFSREVQFNDEFRLWLDLYEDEEVEFLERARKYQCPNIRELSIENVYISEHISEVLNKFLQNSTPENIGDFSFMSDSDYDTDKSISTFSTGLKSLLPSVTGNVEISDFDLNQESLIDILQNSSCTNLLIYDCRIKIDKDFRLDSLCYYSIKTLVLEGSWKKNDDEYLNRETLPILARALSKTNLKHDLQKVRVLNHDYLQKEVQDIFKQYSMHIEVNEKANLDIKMEGPARKILF